MNNTELLKKISFNLTSVDFAKVGTEWNYNDIISSFSRMFLITGGEAFIYIGEKKIHLRKGYIYLIPSFVHCSYVCKKQMEHYYTTFTIHLPEDLSIYQIFNFSYEIKATRDHYNYFKTLSEANPLMALPSKNPKNYQRTNSKNWNSTISNAQQSLVTSGLLYMLFSNFIATSKNNFDKSIISSISLAVKYIHSHLNENLTVVKLAEMTYLSTGHFTRKFKELTQFNPLNYINKQRVEKAQLLLNTTSSSCVQIAETCGFKSNAYFCKTFKKYIGISPGEYRKNKSY
ncbi:MAG: helix-turn-helix transcriptional regulator [Reichenbachiella sp.]